jgi:hypothetical protein
LLKATACKVLRRFQLAGGKIAEVGSVITLPRHDAESMAALKRVELLA